MIGVLIVTHGDLGQALVDAAAMLVSENSLLSAVGFQPGEGVEDLDAKARAALAGLEPNEGVLCLADLPGGSPARVLGALLFERSDLELVTGANLSMLVEILLLRRELSLKELVQHALKAGAGSIMDIGALLRREAGSGG